MRESNSTSPGPPSEVEELYARSRTRVGLPLARNERLVSMLLGGAFLVVAAGLAVTTTSHRSPSAAVVIALVVAYGGLASVEFEIGPGSVIPTELVFVPMLFLLPLGWVPLAVAAGYWGSLNADVVRGHRHRERVLVLLCSCWYAVGPVAVLLVAGEGPPRWDRWPIYLTALGAQFGADLASAIVREWQALGIAPRRLLPFAARAYAVDLALAPLGLLAAFAAVEWSWAFLLVLPLAWLLAVFARERGQRIGQELELREAYRGTVLLLGDIIEADDEYTGSHSRGVVELVTAVGELLQLSPRESRQAEFTALLQDVGKIRISKEIIQKPGPLTAAERRTVETHTIEGERILAQVGGSLAEVGHIVRSCHEWYDGNGYPDGLRGEQIPLIARIVCCCDAFSAMTTDRPYRRALPAATAIAELRACSGTQFDPRVVEALLAVLGDAPAAGGLARAA
jgi:HD-GYP domain-containing protein (c-di-GMP phosphodiesterase class II)